MRKVYLGLLPYFVFLVRAMDPQLTASSDGPCSNGTLTFTCVVDDTAQALSFHKGNSSTRARCLVDLTRDCSPTFPAGFPCGCVSAEGNTKTTQFKIDHISSDSDGTWLAAIPVRGAPNIVSNEIVITVDDRDLFLQTAIPLVVVLGVVIIIVVVVVPLVLCKAESTAVKIAVVVVALVVLLAFILAVGIYNINDHLDCTRDTPNLYGGTLACIIIGAFVSAGCVVGVIVAVVKS